MTMTTERFTWLNKQGVRGATGFEVQRVDRFTIHYREGGKIVTVPIEPGFSAGRPVVIIGADAFSKWDPPFTSVAISSEAQLKIRNNFVAAMEFQGMGVSIE